MSIFMSKPLALAGDSKRLTLPGGYETASHVGRVQSSQQRKLSIDSVEELNHTRRYCKQHFIWLPKPKEMAVWATRRPSWKSFQRAVYAKGEQGRGRSSYGGPSSCARLDSTQIFSGTGSRFCQRQNHTYCLDLRWMFDRCDIMDMECARKIADQRRGYCEAPCSKLQGMRSLLQFKLLTKRTRFDQ